MRDKRRIDWIITLVPLLMMVAVSTLFLLYPERSNDILSRIKYLFCNSFGTYYLVIGIAFLGFSLYFAFSKIGDIVLGEKGETPKYSFFTWGCMMFTCGIAADILFYSFAEWIMYAANPHISELGEIQEWAPVFPIFHWSFIPWSFYLVLAVAFGFMLHVSKKKRQKYSEACRPVLGKYADGFAGRIIDLLAVFALIAGTGTTFSVATPLISKILEVLFHISIDRKIITIVVLLLTCIVYTTALLRGIRGIGMLAKFCIYMFLGIIIYVLLFTGYTGYIIDTGFEAIGRMFQNFIGLATYTDPRRKNNFPQDWTIYYWAYWMVWCVAAPFFIGSISKGRTIRQTILGGYVFGTGSTVVGFVVLGNYSMGLQMSGVSDYVSQYNSNGDIYSIIVDIINTMPLSSFVLGAVLITMIAFYATSFDSIAYMASCYSYREINEGQQPAKYIQLLWCILLIILPVALVFSESSMSNLQSLSIITAFPIGIVMIIIVYSFVKEVRTYMSG